MSRTLSVLMLLLVQDGPHWFQQWPEPRVLRAYYASSGITIDGDPDEPAWAMADWSAPFVDITGDPARFPNLTTRAALLWNDTALFIAARLEEPHVWGTLLARDTVIYLDNDFEFFFDPDGDNHRYGEIEINARNTVWDLLLEKPYRDGGPAINAWNVAGMVHAVHIEGTINSPGDTDTGWSVELSIPWRDIARLSENTYPPEPGSSWRVNFSRVQWRLRVTEGMYEKAPGREENWVWAPIGVVNMHVPERWGELVFLNDPAEKPPSRPTGWEAARRAVMEGYHAQHAFRKVHERWGISVHELNGVVGRSLDEAVAVRITDSGFEIAMGYEEPDGGRSDMVVTHEGKLSRRRAEQ